MSDKSRMMVHAWYYEELISRTESLIKTWLDGKCASSDLHEWDAHLPRWIDETILTPDCSQNKAARLEKRLKDLVLRIDHLTNVAILMRDDPCLQQLDRKNACVVADTTGMPLGEPVLTGPFQWRWENQSPSINHEPS